MQEALTLWTIRAALALYVVVLASKPTKLSRILYTLGCLLTLVHIAAAMHYYHHDSHAEAVAETARQTKELFGVEFGGGVYFNYVFAALWIADAAWWWMAKASYERRPLWVALVVHGYLLFIAINGAIVFADGPVRWIGVAACIVLAALRVGCMSGAKCA